MFNVCAFNIQQVIVSYSSSFIVTVVRQLQKFVRYSSSMAVECSRLFIDYTNQGQR